ncbi:hypothetical protein FAF44_04910 [Nonomuraea sp. MG754425]|uniref:hypothetical protein n=1 Tax=Nonomuraea sp. MG754425 TaxID=2570319 RepID=UPI001F40004D|nr:hypothetical protein [Nonomuraea sp. MG754425]MCF6467751.1 hypothetical protein [Nonomuraea sp. MG754425]
MGNPDRESHGDSLHLNPYLVTFESDGRVHEPATMRAVADALAERLRAMEKSELDGSAMTEIQLGAAQFGEWVDAKLFGAAAGKDSAGQKFGHVHAEFIKAYKNVIAAIEASAGNHAEADARNEGA